MNNHPPSAEQRARELLFRYTHDLEDVTEELTAIIAERDELKQDKAAMLQQLIDGGVSGAVAGPTIADAIAEYKATRGSSAVKLLHKVLDKIIGLKCRTVTAMSTSPSKTKLSRLSWVARNSRRRNPARSLKHGFTEV